MNYQNNKSLDKSAEQFASSISDNWKVTLEPHEQKTFTQQVRDQTDLFLTLNKGVALISIGSYMAARGSGKTHEEALGSFAWGLQHGRKLEKFYNRCVELIKGV